MSRSTRDYAQKQKAKGKTKKKSNGLNPLWLIATALVGVFAFGLVYLTQHEKIAHSPKQVAKAVKQTQKISQRAEKPRFEFYNVLPKTEVATHSEDRVSAIKHGYELQVASVRQYKDADRLKAQLILMGYDVNIKQFSTKRGTFNRISVGPYPSERAAQLAQNALAKEHFNAIIRSVE